MIDWDGLKLSEDELEEMSSEELRDLYDKVMEQYEKALATGDVRIASDLKEYRDELEELLAGFEE